MSDIPQIEVYDESDNWLPVVKVERKAGGTLIITVEREDPSIEA